mmetsp:Transcript_6962/g.11495  ORF Transcript_6962/g.11495 Transcript_6962/m.11495 type:complete len:304 (-) Transcript_6962:151-1062(-)
MRGIVLYFINHGVGDNKQQLLIPKLVECFFGGLRGFLNLAHCHRDIDRNIIEELIQRTHWIQRGVRRSLVLHPALSVQFVILLHHIEIGTHSVQLRVFVVLPLQMRRLMEIEIGLQEFHALGDLHHNGHSVVLRQCVRDIQLILAHCGHHILFVMNGLESQRTAKRQHIDIVFLHRVVLRLCDIQNRHILLGSAQFQRQIQQPHFLLILLSLRLDLLVEFRVTVDLEIIVFVLFGGQFIENLTDFHVAQRLIILRSQRQCGATKVCEVEEFGVIDIEQIEEVFEIAVEPRDDHIDGSAGGGVH